MLKETTNLPIEQANIKSLEQLIQALDPNEKNVENYSKVMQSINFGHGEVKKYCVWTPSYYTRNLIHRTYAYELLLLCWMPNQSGPIHNHESQYCWFYLIDGCLEETQYQLTVNNDNNTTNIEETKKTLLKSRCGYSSFISGNLAFHRLRNTGKKNAISLHLYSYPVDYCDVVYSEKKGLFTKHKLSYHSKKGKLIGEN